MLIFSIDLISFRLFKNMIREKEEWLTQSELSQVIKAGPVTLWKLRNEGLPFYRLGGQVRYKLSEVEEFLRRRKCKRAG